MRDPLKFHSLVVNSGQSFDHTQSPMPAQTNIMPTHVSLEMILPSAYHSPSTVKRNASEFVMGTVSDNSVSTLLAKHSNVAVLQCDGGKFALFP